MSYLSGKHRLTLVAILLSLALGGASVSASAATITSPVNAKAQTGKTYGEWSASWWQYVLQSSTSSPNNPLLDATGQGCAAGQATASPVFFLVGVAGAGRALRDQCTVPSGKYLFFPLLNFVDIHVPGDGLDTPELVRQDLLSFIGPITDLHATVDDVTVANLDPRTTPYRACAGGDPACAPAFSVTLPGQNLFGVPGGTYAPAVADGFYLMVSPLPPGAHTINFGGKGRFAKSNVFQDITYELTAR